MNELELIKSRHSVRRYKNLPLSAEIKEKLNNYVYALNKDSGLNFQMVYDEPSAFSGLMAKYGKFLNVTNYLALVGNASSKNNQAVGYYGEKFVLYAQSLGLNTCWVALTYKKVKTAFKVEKGEKLYMVISVGYGLSRGVKRKSKQVKDVCNLTKDTPPWFISGVESALLAPTAVNQQAFYFTLNGNKVTLKNTLGFYSKVDLGIVKLHFEIGAGKENFIWN